MARALRSLTAYRVAAVAVVAVATTLAIAWVFLVPVLQSPDEDGHFDYVMTLYDAGHLVRANDRPLDPNFHIRNANPMVAFLEDWTAFDVVRHSPEVKMPPGYATSADWSAFDAAAPSGAPQHFNPAIIRGYPYGYYAIDAVWLRLVRSLDSRPSALLFEARLLNPLLLALSMVLSYGAIREVAGRGTSLATITMVGLLPMTTFVSSYVQPDNLAFTATAAMMLGGLRLRRAPSDRAGLALFSAGLAAMTISKAHYVPYVTAASLACAVIPYWAARPSLPVLALRLGAVAIPATLLEAVDLWVTGGRPVGLATRSTAQVTNIAALLDAMHHGPGALAAFLVRSAGDTLFDFYVAGNTSLQFWGWFGWLDTPLVIGSIWLRVVIAAATIAVVVLTLASLWRIGLATWRSMRRGRRRAAWNLLASNPLIAAFLLVTVAEFGVAVVSDDTVGTQGRYWLPVLPGLFLAGTQLAPRALRRRRWRVAASRIVATSVLAYVMVASVVAFPTLQSRYYGNGRTVAAMAAPPSGAAPGGRAAFTYLVPSGRDFTQRFDPTHDDPSVPAGGQLAVGGWVDLAGAKAVWVRIDGADAVPAVYGDDGPGNRADGFDTVLRLDRLATGVHELSVVVADSKGRAVEPSARAHFTVVAAPATAS